MRKAIILLYYFNYIISISSPIDEPVLVDETEYSIEEFIERLNEILGKCHLGKLYLANKFDWLILECASSPVFNDENVAKLNDILKLSLPENFINKT